MPEHPIFAAVKALDVEALRRELAAGVDPDMYEDSPYYPDTPLLCAVRSRSASDAYQIRERLEIISLLLEAGASVDLVASVEQTPLHHAAHSESQAFHAVVGALLEAGADVNYVGWGGSVLASAAKCGTAGAVRMLISAGAVDLDRALELAIMNDKRRNCTPLLRAGAATPATLLGLPQTPPMHSYIQRIRAAGGFKAYEKAHRQRLAAIFLAKFPTLPVEMLERVVEFSYDAGGH